MIPKNISKGDILKAINKIAIEGIPNEKRKATKYALLQDGKEYPPKYVISLANEFANKLFLSHDQFSSQETNSFLAKLGFEIVNNNLENELTINKEAFLEYWEQYKTDFRVPGTDKDEIYKWSVLKQVYEKWNWALEDKAKMFEGAFEVKGPKNLWQSGNFYPIAHTNWMFKAYPKETATAITNLFNELKPVTQRATDFINFYNEKLPELQLAYPDKKVEYHSHNDLRAISLYLTLQYPEKYFLYKFGMVKKFFVKMELPKIKGGDKENLVKFYKVGNQVLDFIKEDTDFLEEYQLFTNQEQNYKDSSLHLLTQDFIYKVANYFNQEEDMNNTFNLVCEGVKAKLASNKAIHVVHKLQKGYMHVSRIGGSFNTVKNHYELVSRGSNLFVEAHFENKKTNKNLKSLIGVLPDGYEWMKWFDSYSFRQVKSYSLTEEDLIEKITEDFIKMDSLFGERIENALKGINMKKLNFISPPVNQILYGPPGTGKTYNTILEAAKIVEEDNDISYQTAQSVFNERLGNEIEFITFHQNYSYEDFIQGLRPETEGTGQLSFYKSDGVFKKIADRALKNLRESENPVLAKKSFDTVFNGLLEPLTEGVEEELEIEMKQTSFYITEVGEKSIEFRKNQGDSKHTLSINTLRKMYEMESNEIIVGGLQPYYNPILNLLLDSGKTNVAPVEKKNFVIIIDEINRANISRVFGELITLIEKDKRSHGNLPISATLPSGESFIVPSNLFIIGTMNTADKSIALLDIALRRRFEFIPMYPLYEILKDKSNLVNDASVLKKINDIIILRKGHDFTIGHSYFMGEDYNFKNTINNKVIPLLIEYFMNNTDEVTKILKEASIKVDGWPLKLVEND